MRTVADIEAAALRAVNQARQHFAHKPLRAMPSGRPGEPDDCPINRALRELGLGRRLRVMHDRVEGVRPGLVDELTMVWGNPGRIRVKASLRRGEVPLPRSLRRFVVAFDSEELLHLTINSIGKPEDALIKEESASLVSS